MIYFILNDPLLENQMLNVFYSLRVFFQCNSENVEPTSRDDHVEPETGVRYTEASVDIHRDLVEEYFQEFHCACVAISGKGSVVSRHALVTNACKLKKTTAVYFKKYSKKQDLVKSG